nr:MAG: hypothetical protein [Lactococcus phage NR01]
MSFLLNVLISFKAYIFVPVSVKLIRLKLYRNDINTLIRAKILAYSHIISFLFEI